MAWMSLVVMQVMVPFFQSRGLSLSQVYQLQAYFALLIIVLDAPAGYIADLWGRKACIQIGAALNGIAYVILAFSENWQHLIWFETFCAMGVSLLSGTDIALIYDSLDALDDQGMKAGPIVGKRMFYINLGEALASLVGGFLAAISLEFPARVNAVTAWIAFFIAFTLFEPPRSKLDKRAHWKNFSTIYRSVFRHSKLLTLVILNYIVYGFASLAAVWAYQAYWRHLDIPISYFGYLWAAYSLLGAISARTAYRVERKIGSVTAILIVAALPVIGFFGMGYFGTFVGVIFGASFAVCRGLNQVLLQDAVNARVPASMRATANSIANLGVRVLFGLLGPVTGYLLDQEGFQFTFYVLALGYVGAFFLFVLPLLSQRRFFVIR